MISGPVPLARATTMRPAATGIPHSLLYAVSLFMLFARHLIGPRTTLATTHRLFF
jgi:hypothetical protein